MMRGMLFLSLAGLVASPLLADSGMLKVSEVRHASFHLDRNTGVITKTGGDQGVRGGVCWDSTQTTGYFSSFAPDQLAHDWGDADNATCLSAISGFQLGYASDLIGGPIAIDLVYYSDDNGFDDVGRTSEVGFRITGLPQGTTVGLFLGWLVTFTVTPSFDISSADLDGIPGGDFSYTYHMRNVPADGHAGPLISADPNTAVSIGAENAFDLFTADPNVIIGPNDFLLPDINTLYDGTFWFGGTPYAQWHMQLSTGGNAPPNDCPLPGCGTSDIEPAGGGDCDVDLTDLAVLLGNFGTTSGATKDDGDIEPSPGGVDGDVDLTDLAVMLGDFGTVCS